MIAGFLAGGSSPRMRGTRAGSLDMSRILGIIPAYAGNTDSLFTSFLWFRDHPRVCGEHRQGRVDWSVRGGIIPAYAGNTFQRPGHFESWRDHPRVCGEHAFNNAVRITVKGSSPRMRGTLPHAGARIRQSGIIPAYAGNTGVVFPHSMHSRDHPRVCGEHFVLLILLSPFVGSSPRMRGTH